MVQQTVTWIEYAYMARQPRLLGSSPVADVQPSMVVRKREVALPVSEVD
jgi:hypothetical protein